MLTILSSVKSKKHLPTTKDVLYTPLMEAEMMTDAALKPRTTFHAKARSTGPIPDGVRISLETDQAIMTFNLDDESGKFFAACLAQHYKLFQFEEFGGKLSDEPLKPNTPS
jgi:hypothetical protein